MTSVLDVRFIVGYGMPARYMLWAIINTKS